MSLADGPAGFDRYATNYHDELNRGLTLAGEDADYFAHARVAWLTGRLGQLGVRPATVLDFGCGTGSTVPLLLGIAGVESVVGTDASAASLAVARDSHPGPEATFQPLDAPIERPVDLAYCNGVFHHIPPAERPGALRYVRGALRPGGLFALWENNPWNPGTRMIMNRIPFDRDAETLSYLTARRLLRESGFDVIRTDFAFIFPNALPRPASGRATRGSPAARRPVHGARSPVALGGVTAGIAVPG